MDEHLALLDAAAEIEHAVGDHDHNGALLLLDRLAGLLDRHVRREEDGVFTALKDLGPPRSDQAVVDEIAELEQEHTDFHAQIAALDPADPEFADRLRTLFAHLSEHIDREDLGVFPVSVVSLGVDGWDRIARVHAEQPSFLAGA